MKKKELVTELILKGFSKSEIIEMAGIRAGEAHTKMLRVVCVLSSL